MFSLSVIKSRLIKNTSNSSMQATWWDTALWLVGMWSCDKILCSHWFVARSCGGLLACDWLWNDVTKRGKSRIQGVHSTLATKSSTTNLHKKYTIRPQYKQLNSKNIDKVMRTHLCLTKSEVLKYNCRSNLLCATTLCLGILSQTSLDTKTKH